MKLTSFLLLAGCLQLSAAGMSQTITFKGKGVPLLKVFSEIKKQTGYAVMYNADQLKKARPVDIDARNIPLVNFLNEVLKGQPFEYTIENTTIFISLKIVSEIIVPKLPDASAVPPPINVIGKIITEKGEPAAGVSVSVKGTNRSTATDAGGNFILNGIDNKAVLVISGVNIETLETSINGRVLLNITVHQKLSELGEVVVNKGYYTESQLLSTGGTSVVSGKVIEKQPVVNPLLAMQGRVTGLMITQNTGVANGSVNVQIRGRSSLNSAVTNDPLYVIDGVPFQSQLLYDIRGNSGVGTTDLTTNLGGNPLNYLNPYDIERIDILKDADATAIYGSRGGNGVILITTKKGKEGKMEFGLNINRGVMLAPKSLKLMNTEQYIAMRKEAFANDGISLPSITNPAQANDINYDINGTWSQSKYTDWQKELIGKYAGYTNLNISLSGGNQMAKYAIRGMMNRQASVFPGNLTDTRGALSFNINSTSANQQFKINFSGSYMKDNNQNSGSDLSGATLRAPNAPDSWNPDGTLNFGGVNYDNANNPYALTLQTYSNKTDNLVLSLMPSYRIIKGLLLSANLGFTKLSAKIDNFYPGASYSPNANNFFGPNVWHTDNTQRSWIVEPQLSYEGQFKGIKLNSLIGTTFQQRNDESKFILGYNFVSDAFIGNIANAGAFLVGDAGSANYKYNAVFARMNASLKSKYVLNLTGRRDGSSKFGPDKQFANFYSAGVAWIFSKENLISQNLHFLSLGKLRGNFGTSGNDGIANYQYYDLYQRRTGTYQGATGYAPSSLANPDVAWEENAKLEMAMDLGFFNDRVITSITWYRNRSSNQLLAYTIPSFTGFSFVPAFNFPATVQNAGYEVTVNTVNFKKTNFRWSTSFNLSINRNKLLKFDNLASSTYANKLAIGEPVIGRALVYIYNGIDPTQGIYTFEKRDGTPGMVSSYGNPVTTDPVFKTKVINTAPKFFGGLNNSFSYKNFQLDFFLQFVKQTGKASLVSQFAPGVFANTPGSPLSASSNVSTIVLDRWQHPGDNSRYQKFTQSSTGNMAQSAWGNSDASYVDASFIRLKNIAISYQLPTRLKERLKLKDCGINIQAQNVFTITSYKGRDPETQTFGTLPPLKVITVGIQFNL